MSVSLLHGTACPWCIYNFLAKQSQAQTFQFDFTDLSTVHSSPKGTLVCVFGDSNVAFPNTHTKNAIDWVTADPVLFFFLKLFVFCYPPWATLQAISPLEPVYAKLHKMRSEKPQCSGEWLVNPAVSWFQSELQPMHPVLHRGLWCTIWTTSRRRNLLLYLNRSTHIHVYSRSSKNVFNFTWHRHFTHGLYRVFTA